MWRVSAGQGACDGGCAEGGARTMDGHVVAQSERELRVGLLGVLQQRHAVLLHQRAELRVQSLGSVVHVQQHAAAERPVLPRHVVPRRVGRLARADASGCRAWREKRRLGERAELQRERGGGRQPHQKPGRKYV